MRTENRNSCSSAGIWRGLHRADVLGEICGGQTNTDAAQRKWDRQYVFQPVCGGSEGRLSAAQPGIEESTGVYAMQKPEKDEFELLYLRHFEEMYQLADMVDKRLERIRDMMQLYRRSL